MGDMYRFRTDVQFARTYAWRKYNMAKTKAMYGEALDSSYQWVIPALDRENWKDDVSVGHMVVNYPEDENFQEFNTTNNTSIGDVKNDISLALASTDEYVVYYCQQQEWLDVVINLAMHNKGALREEDKIISISANSWAIGGSVLRKFIKSKVSIKRFNIMMALLLVLSIIPTFFE